ncbi:MAG: hypothetical protein L3J82_04085 [Planctomycetes bacterium]|nr:hypothetical protein [Planctomycetota bacterium]
MRAILILLALLVSAPALLAFEELVGKDAPDFDARTCVNKPEDATLAACKGNVILIYFWGPT